MKQDQIFGIIRTVLMAVGAYMLGHNLFGKTVDESLWQEIVGALMAVVAFVWSIFSKELTLERLEGFLRQLITFSGTFLLGSGLIKPDTLAALLALVPIIGPLILSAIMKKKNAQIDSGEITKSQLKQ